MKTTFKSIVDPVTMDVVKKFPGIYGIIDHPGVLISFGNNTVLFYGNNVFEICDFEAWEDEDCKFTKDPSNTITVTF